MSQHFALSFAAGGYHPGSVGSLGALRRVRKKKKEKDPQGKEFATLLSCGGKFAFRIFHHSCWVCVSSDAVWDVFRVELFD